MYILILTLLYKSGNGGMGGVSMQEFSSLDSCKTAGYHWTQTQKRAKGNMKDDEISYLCVKK